MPLDPIIAVKDVEQSSSWYQAIFACRGKHGGDHFEVLVDAEGEILLCLHKWGEHNHSTMKNPKITPGNGLILYFRVTNLEEVYDNVVNAGHNIEVELQPNPNSGKREFSIIDPNGYYLTVSEYHEF